MCLRGFFDGQTMIIYVVYWGDALEMWIKIEFLKRIGNDSHFHLTGVMKKSHLEYCDIVEVCGDT